MSAHWPAIEDAALPGPTLERIGLAALLRLTASSHPDRIALVDPADKAQWSGRAAITWTYAAAAEIVDRLARGLRGWRLAAGSRIGIQLPGGSESALAFLAVEAAGHLPCLLPIGWNADKLAAAAQSAGLAAILTQARVASLAAAERACLVASRNFGLRYLAAFGPDVPDGVINLDRLVLEGRDPAQPPSVRRTAPCGLVTFAGGDPDRPVHRGGAALVAAAAAHLVASRVAPGERILCLLAPHDLRGLATGLAAALVAGASFETLPLFDGAAFAASLARDCPTHLVVPAALERNLAGRDLPRSLRSLTVVHRAPVAFPARTRRRDAGLRVEAVIDAVAIDERAIVCGRRGGPGDVALTFARPERLTLPETLMAIRREPDGRLAFKGRACTARPLDLDEQTRMSEADWVPTPYASRLAGGLATAVMPWAGAERSGPSNPFATA